MKSDDLKESRNIEDRRGQGYTQSSGNNLGGGDLAGPSIPGQLQEQDRHYPLDGSTWRRSRFRWPL